MTVKRVVGVWALLIVAAASVGFGGLYVGMNEAKAAPVVAEDPPSAFDWLHLSCAELQDLKETKSDRILEIWAEINVLEQDLLALYNQIATKLQEPPSTARDQALDFLNAQVESKQIQIESLMGEDNSLTNDITGINSAMNLKNC